jgi:hypothetical protein
LRFTGKYSGGQLSICNGAHLRAAQATEPLPFGHFRTAILTISYHHFYSLYRIAGKKVSPSVHRSRVKLKYLKLLSINQTI